MKSRMWENCLYGSVRDWAATGPSAKPSNLGAPSLLDWGGSAAFQALEPQVQPKKGSEAL